MRTSMLSLIFVSLLGACGGKSAGPTSPPMAPPDAGAPPCCDPAANPGGIEGAHCCADGTWRGDIGNGGSEECQEAGGDGVVCPD